jgi:predicted Rossmann fold flavoprotein
VIGGGAAGMIAAWRAARLGASVTLLEKNPRLGIKILVSGGGKCNITHGGTMEEMRLRFQTSEARFLRHAFHCFTNADIRAMLDEKGVATYERPNGKIFPVNEKAGDIVHAFRRLMEEAGVDIRCSSPAKAIRRDADGVTGVELEGAMLESRRIILATGGLSYRKTGTTGDGYAWAQSLGHSIVPLRPALAPIVTSPVPPHEWQGVAVREGSLLAHADGKILARYSADLLFTHFGISGPAVLELSSEIVRACENNAVVQLAVDFLPGRSAEQIDQSLVDDIRSNGAQEIKTWLEYRIPQRLVPYFCESCAVDGSTKCRQLKKEDRRSIVRMLKQWTFGSVKDIDLDRGEVTSGGIPLHEVEPRSMRSRIVPGLYCCGEVLDIAGPVGGYNLQAAFSTGFVAGTSAAEDAVVEKNSP